MSVGVLNAFCTWMSISFLSFGKCLLYFHWIIFSVLWVLISALSVLWIFWFYSRVFRGLTCALLNVVFLQLYPDILSCGHAFQCVFISHSEFFISSSLQFFLICFLCWNALICCWRFHLCCWSSHLFSQPFQLLLAFLSWSCIEFICLYPFWVFFLVNFWNFHLASYLLQCLWVH